MHSDLNTEKNTVLGELTAASVVQRGLCPLGLHRQPESYTFIALLGLVL